MELTVWLETNNNKVTGKRRMQRGKMVQRNGTGCYENIRTGGSDLIREIRMCASRSHKKAKNSHAHS